MAKVMAKTVKLADIAAIVNVSTVTVSKALSDQKGVSEEMRARIKQLAKEMGYQTPTAARLSSNKRTYNIGVLISEIYFDQTQSFYWQMYQSVATKAVSKECFTLLEVLSMQNEKEMILPKLLQEEKMDGLIIIGRCNKEALKKLNKKYKSVVSVNRNSTNYEVDEVLCDGKKIAAAAVEYLIFLGHKNIGYIGQCHSEDRYNGYLETLKKHDLDVIPEYVIETKQTEAEGYEAMEKFFQSDDMPTGIYCANDISAIGMLKCLNKFRNRYYMPSIISSDDIQEAQFTRPMLTTVSLPKEDMGKFALYLLLDRLKGGHSGIVRMELEGRLMIRNSCSSVEDSMWSDYCI